MFFLGIEGVRSAAVCERHSRWPVLKNVEENSEYCGTDMTRCLRNT